ncbi:IclR family transcriptional regulator [Petroclostridium sp. X23]|uniref:IclR family transcriptional regulator n=1 Tax=Petroclostridium sp. X23 TaxID=3045146 RepID=UPI0024ACBAD1|nr:IclR family transcriptional regulator [Petroclostridium sp. X23]WHH61480.1 IclR family transcriptional regulator [Petroclostridium sp. X23]
MSEKRPHLIQSVERALKILDCFDPLNTQLSLSEISEKVGLNISTVHGILNTLFTYSYIDRNPDNGKYRLGLKFLFKANLVSDNLDLKEIGHPFIKALTEKYQETTNLCFYQNGEIYCVDTVWSPLSYLIVSSKVGYGLPIHATASGKLILANLSQEELEKNLRDYNFAKLTKTTITDKQQLLDMLDTIRKQGFSTEEEEVEFGAYSVAAPIKNHKGRVFATVSISGPVARIKENEAQIREDLIETSKAISREFGWTCLDDLDTK